MRLTRRELLRMSLATGVVAAMPSWAMASDGGGAGPHWGKHLVLVELDGGNDGLNTLIPVIEEAIYLARRPTLRIATADRRSLTGVTGFTLNLNLVDGPGNGRFRRLWDAQRLAIVQGVGMPNQNRSHFRGIDIWNSGSAVETLWTTGWLQRALAAAAAPPASVVAQAAILSRPTSDPLAGTGLNVLALSDPVSFIRQSAGMQTVPLTGPAALQHVLRVQDGVLSARSDFATRFGWNPAANNGNGAATTVPTFAGDSGNALFPSGNFGSQCRAVAQMIAAGVGVPIFKIRIGGFDNHASQRIKHDDLLAQFAHGLTGLADALHEKGRLADTLIMTYSEFGRRVEENGSLGTDHGTLAPHFLISGGFGAGARLHGSMPLLTDLDNRGDLKWIAGTSIDYRRLYATALRWLGLPENVFAGAFAPLDGLVSA